MKIALLGAPGAGKTAVAKSVTRRLNQHEQWKIVDGYVEKLQKRTGIPFGEISTFAHNFAVMTDRWVREAELQTQECHSITCGSIYETIMYASFSTMFSGTTEGVMMYDQIFYQTMMQALGGFEQRTYDYDAIFWLPWSDKQIADEANQHTWGAVINAKLPEALDGFGKYAIPLTGSTTVRAARVVEVVRTLQAIPSTSDDESGVRVRTEDSEVQEHQSKPLSDVSSDSN